MRIVKFLTEPGECADYLEGHGLEALTSDPKPARAPPEFEEYVDLEPPDEWYETDSPFYED